MRQNDVDVEVPPHLQEGQADKKKKNLTSQQILEYVCWLVDANAIYEASLLTYDIELAAMTARCTQMVITLAILGSQIVHPIFRRAKRNIKSNRTPEKDLFGSEKIRQGN